MTITDDHIKSLCQLIQTYDKKYKEYPFIISSPKLIDAFFQKKLILELELYHYIIEAYYQNKGTLTYKNNLTPEGIVLFKTEHSVIIHRLYGKYKPENDNNEILTENVFRNVEFDLQL